MPTVQQLPPATIVNPTDELLLDQSGNTVSATVEQLLAAGSAELTLTGDVTGSGTGTIVTTIAPVATSGTFTKVTVNAKGQVTGGGAVASSDVVNALGFTPYNSANPAGYVAASALAPVATSGSYAALTGTPTLGSLASQNAGAVAITGGAVTGVDLSGNDVTAAGGTTARTLGARASDRLNVLDYGADPTGVADSAAAFLAAMNAVPSGDWGMVLVPKGNYKLGSFVNQPSGRSIAVVFDEGAVTSGGGLGVDRVESKQGPFSLWQGGGGWFGFAPTVGAPVSLGFHTDVVENTAANSGAMRVGWAHTYSNYNYYGKYVSGIDIAEQGIFSWPHIYDNSSGWGHWEVILGPTWDEDSQARAHISASAEHSEFDVANNGPEAGWTFRSGVGNSVQGMSIDTWGQNGPYGGHILYSYGSVGSYDGQAGGLNQRWPSYPAVFSNGNPPAVAQNSTIVITFDVTAHGTASLSNIGGVNTVAINNGGGAYTSPPTVVFSGGGGSGAVATPVMLSGSVVGVTITSPGAGYTSPPTVSFTGGGVAGPSATTVTLNTDGAHGDLVSVAAAINAAAIPNVRAAASVWGGVVTRLVLFGIATADLGTLTLGGTAIGPLGITAGAHATPRDTTVVVLGGTSGASAGHQLTINNTVITIGGAGAQSDVVNAINNANLPGIRADVNANGYLVVTAWLPQSPGGLVLAQPTGATTLAQLGLTAGTFWPPTPPKAFATAYGELSSPVCITSNQISVAATDLAGNNYGPVTVTLNGGGGSGWPADVAASIQAALTSVGWANNGAAQLLSAVPAVVIAYSRGGGSTQGVVIRNTAGGTLTLANVTGTPLQTMGIAPGTYRPGGYSAGAQSVFMAAEDSIAPQGRGLFVGGASNATDRTVWPHAPVETRGSFLHGIRTDKATFDDNNAVIVGASQAIAFGTGSGSITLTNVGGSLAVNGTAVAAAAAVPTHVSQLTNDAGFIAAPAIPAGTGTLLGGTATPGTATTVALGANLTLAGGTLSATGAAGVNSFNGRSGVVSLTSADVTGALGYTPGSGGGSVGSVVAGAGLAGGTITTTGTVSLGALAAGTLMGNAGTLTAVPGAITVGSGLTLSPAGTLSNAGVFSFNSRAGAVSLASGDVTGALGYTPANKAGDTFSGAVTLSAGGALSGALVNGGTISGGTVAPASAVIGSATTNITVTNTIDSGGDPLLTLKPGGSSSSETSVQIGVNHNGYVQFADAASTAPNQGGADSVDLQLIRAANTQVTAGQYAFAAGAQNRAAGKASATIGQGNTATGQGSVVLGQNAADNGTMGSLVFSAGYLGQSTAFQLAGVSAAGTAVRLTADGNAPSATNVMNLTANQALGGLLTVTARNIANGDVALWTVTTLYKNSAGTLSVLSPGTGAIGPAVADATLAAATLTVSADTTDSGLNITITPPTGVVVHASALLQGSQIA
jgi:hypothetical protein